MAERKCTACGSTDLTGVDMVRLLGIVLEGGRSKELPESYACNACGHIDMYARNETISRLQTEKKAKAEKDAEKEKLKKTLDELKAKEEELRAIISDENQTVKVVKQAEADLADVMNEISETERALKSRTSNRWKSPF